MHLESETTTVNKSQQEVFEFLTDVHNYEKIMPESIEKFEIKGDDSFLFQLKGMPVIGLKMQDKTPYHSATLGSMSDKFAFTLKADIQELDHRDWSKREPDRFRKFNASFFLKKTYRCSF